MFWLCNFYAILWIVTICKSSASKNSWFRIYTHISIAMTFEDPETSILIHFFVIGLDDLKQFILSLLTLHCGLYVPGTFDFASRNCLLCRLHNGCYSWRSIRSDEKIPQCSAIWKAQRFSRTSGMVTCTERGHTYHSFHSIYAYPRSVVRWFPMISFICPTLRK